MTFYVVYRAPRNNKNRGVIPNELRSLGCVQLHKSLWEVQEEKTESVLQILQRHEPILLRRTREIRRPQWNRKGVVTDIGSLSVVAYSIPNGKRKVINRALRKMPCIPLCRAVYAFPQKHRLSHKENKPVTTLLKLIKENHGDVKVTSRIIIEDQNSIKKLLHEIADRIQKETSHIIASCKALAHKAEKEDDSRARLSKKLTEIKKRFGPLKRVTSSYEKWLRMDFSKNLLKTYRAIKKAQNIIEEK